MKMALLLLCLLQFALSLSQSEKNHFLRQRNNVVKRKLANSNDNIDQPCTFINISSFAIYTLEDLCKSNSQKDHVVFNFCENLKVNKEDIKTTFVRCNTLEKLNNLSTCDKISGSIKDKSPGSSYYSLKVNNGEKDEDKYIKYALSPGSVNFKIICNKTQTEFIPIITEKSNSQYDITVYHYTGCELISFATVSAFFEKYFYVFTIITVATGIFLCFAGRKFMKISIIVITTLLFPLVLLTPLVLLFKVTSYVLMLVILLVGMLLGFALGYGLSKLERFCGGIIGGILGYVVNVFVYSLIISHIKNAANKVLYYCLMAFFIILFAVLGFCLMKVFVILGTSIIGGYAIIRGFSFSFGGFVDEQMIFNLIKYKEFDKLKDLMGYKMYIYLGCWVLLSILGSVVQFKTTKDKNKNKNIKDDFLGGNTVSPLYPKNT